MHLNFHQFLLKVHVAKHQCMCFILNDPRQSECTWLNDDDLGIVFLVGQRHSKVMQEAFTKYSAMNNSVAT